VIADFDFREQGLHMLNRSPTLRPAMTRLILAEIAEDMCLDDLRFAAGIFAAELAQREGRMKYHPSAIDDARDSDETLATRPAR